MTDPSAESPPAAAPTDLDVAEPSGAILVDGHPVERAGDAGGLRFPVEVPGFQGTLDDLVLAAQRGEIDVASVPVAEITSAFRARVLRDDPRPDPREVADFLSLASRLLSLKAARLLPEGPLDALDPESGEEGGPVDDAGARLAEYRLFKAAAEALLGDVAEQGARSFLGLVAPEVVPVERLAIPPERLAAAFRAVLERLPEAEPFGFDTATFSVAEKMLVLRRLLESRPVIAFEEIFEGVASRLEAVACFLALLEILKAGGARVEQSEPFGAITVTALAVSAEG